MDTIAIKAADGCRLVLPEGGQTLDGIGIAPGTDLPDEGAFVTPGIWLRKRLDEGDAVPVSQAAITAAQKRADVRENPPAPPAAKKTDGSQA